MSDATQDQELAPKAEEAGDGGANIDSEAAKLEGDAPEQADVEQPKSAQKQADGDFPIMT